MTRGTARLATLCRLRQRDLDRARQALAEAAEREAKCRAELARAERDLAKCRNALETARANRCVFPADELVQTALACRESECADAEAVVQRFRARLAEAVEQLTNARTDLLRAQARDEATAQLHRQAQRSDLRRRDRRADAEREDIRRRA